MFVNSILGSWPEDAIYTNVWSILNHKIEKFPCQQFSSVKFMFIGPWNLPYILAFCKSLPHWNQFDYYWQDKPFPLKKKKKLWKKYQYRYLLLLYTVHETYKKLYLFDVYLQIPVHTEFAVLTCTKFALTWWPGSESSNISLT